MAKAAPPRTRTAATDPARLAPTVPLAKVLGAEAEVFEPLNASARLGLAAGVCVVAGEEPLLCVRETVWVADPGDEDEESKCEGVGDDVGDEVGDEVGDDLGEDVGVAETEAVQLAFALAATVTVALRDEDAFELRVDDAFRVTVEDALALESAAALADADMFGEGTTALGNAEI
jgi:hypothetical protein